MANLDIRELLSDPDLCDKFTYLKRVELVDPKGEGQLFPRGRQGYGSVQPASGNTLKQLPNLTNVSGVIEIWTRAPLQLATETTQADVIYWKGDRYLVAEKLDDWQHFGAGMCHAVCTLMNLEPDDDATPPIR